MIKLRTLLTENIGTFISVDIQPEYEKAFRGTVSDFTNYLNENHENMNHIVLLYNGEETMGTGMVSEDAYRTWLYYNGLQESVMDEITFYDKGYAFFRYCIDEGVDAEATANFIRFMYENGVNDSRYMSREMWAKYLREYRRVDKKTVFGLLEKTDECVHIPELMGFLKGYNNITLTGGAMDACLREVEIALMALRKPYQVLDEFTYW